MSTLETGEFSFLEVAIMAAVVLPASIPWKISQSRDVREVPRNHFYCGYSVTPE